MAFGDRLSSMLIGCAIGFILGYFVRSLRDIKEELDEVDDILKHELRKNRKIDESGALRIPHLRDIALLIAVLATLWAAVATQVNNNKLGDAVSTSKTTAQQLARVTLCNKDYLAKTIEALNQRTSFAKEQALSNVGLQQSQAKFFDLLLHQPPYSKSRRFAASTLYAKKLHSFVSVNVKTATKIQDFPYPTIDGLQMCLADARADQ